MRRVQAYKQYPIIKRSKTVCTRGPGVIKIEDDGQEAARLAAGKVIGSGKYAVYDPLTGVTTLYEQAWDAAKYVPDEETRMRLFR